MFRLFARPHGADLRASGRRPWVPLCVLLGTSPFGAVGALAQTATGASPSRLDAVVVTGTRTPIRADKNLADVTVIDRDQIEQAAGRTLAELLARQPGIQFSSNGGLGKSSSVFRRSGPRRVASSMHWVSYINVLRRCAAGSA